MVPSPGPENAATIADLFVKIEKDLKKYQEWQARGHRPQQSSAQHQQQQNYSKNKSSLPIAPISERPPLFGSHIKKLPNTTSSASSESTGYISSQQHVVVSSTPTPRCRDLQQGSHPGTMYLMPQKPAATLLTFDKPTFGQDFQAKIRVGDTHQQEIVDPDIKARNKRKGSEVDGDVATTSAAALQNPGTYCGSGIRRR